MERVETCCEPRQITLRGGQAHMKLIANISTLWRDIPLRERLEKVSQAGLDAYEFLFVQTLGSINVAAKRAVRDEVRALRPGHRRSDLQDQLWIPLQAGGGDQVLRGLEEALENAGSWTASYSTPSWARAFRAGAGRSSETLWCSGYAGRA